MATDNYDPNNPGDAAARRMFDRENEAVKDTDNIANNQEKAATDDAAKSTQAKENQAGESHKYTGTGKGKKRKVTGSANLMKKKGPMALIIGLLFGGGAISTILFSPGLAIVQFKQIMLGDLNDQLRAMEVFDTHLINAKLKSMEATFGVCTQKVSILCRFSTMSKREVTNFKNAGITIEPDGKGRIKPTLMIMPDGTEVRNPQDLANYRKNSPEAGSVLRKAFNPKFAGLYDKAANGVFARNGTDRTRKVKGKDNKERQESFRQATAGESAGISADGYRTDEDGRRYVTNSDGTRVYAEQPSSGSLPTGSTVDSGQYNRIVADNIQHLDDLAEKAEAAKNGLSAKKVLSNVGLKGASALAGAEAACQVLNKSEAVSAASKVNTQTLQTAVVVNNVADRTMAGTVTAEEVETVGTMLTAPDLRETIVDESSVWVKEGEEVNAAPHPNPYYNQNALDSAGYRAAAYNEAPTLTSRDMQYRLGGGLGGPFEDVLQTIYSTIGGRDNARDTCGVVQSWWVRGIGLVVGVATTVGTFGASTIVQVGASAALGFAGVWLDAKLQDLIASQFVDSDISGVDLGNAAFAGNGNLYGQLAASHGMTPASSSEFEEYLAYTEPINQERIAAEIYDAKSTPFDIYNQYSFLGSFMYKINPTILRSTASISSAVTSMPRFFSTAISSLTPSVHASGFNPDRLKKCNDDVGYMELGIDPDISCAPRFAMSPRQLAIEPVEGARWMIDNEHIEEDGTPKSDEYKKWIKFCTERGGGWGAGIDEDYSDDAIGLNCVRKEKENSFINRLEHFGAYTMAAQMQEYKDEGPPTGLDATGIAAIGSIVSPLTAGHTTLSGYGPRSAAPGSTSTGDWIASLSLAHSSNEVFAMADGEVIQVGETVVIKHSDGLKSRYSYMDGIMVEVGDEVSVGQEIGRIGCGASSSNTSCREYLGFSLWVDEVEQPDRYRQYPRAPLRATEGASRAINPANFLTTNGVTGFEDQVNEL